MTDEKEELNRRAEAICARLHQESVVALQALRKPPTPLKTISRKAARDRYKAMADLYKAGVPVRRILQDFRVSESTVRHAINVHSSWRRGVKR